MADPTTTLKWENLIVEILLNNPDVFKATYSIIKADYFRENNFPVINYMLDHFRTNSPATNVEEVNILFNSHYRELLTLKQPEYFTELVEKVEKFVRQRACTLAVIKANRLIDRGDESDIVGLVQEATQISLTKYKFVNPFEEISKHLEDLHKQQGELPTGWVEFDKLTDGGFKYGEIAVVAAQSGGGKSLFLNNVASAYVKRGLNVLIVSNELDEYLIMKRQIAVFANIQLASMRNHEQEVQEMVDEQLAQYKDLGVLNIAYMKPGCTVIDLEKIINEYETTNQCKANIVIIDYADRMDPVVKVSAENIHIRGMYIYEELRSLAVTRTREGKKTSIITATQLTKEAQDVNSYSSSNLSGSAHKNYTADLIFSFYAGPEMKKEGRCRITFLKTRNSNGVGQTIHLKFDPNTLAVSNLEVTKSDNDVLNQIINQKQVLSEAPEGDHNSIIANIMKQAG